MIKGFFLTEKPDMSKVTLEETLADIYGKTEEVDPPAEFKNENYEFYKDILQGERFITHISTIKTLVEGYSGKLAARMIYKAIEKATSGFIKVWELGDTLLVVTPKLKNPKNQDTYSQILDEVSRFTGFFIRIKPVEEVIELVRDYFNLICTYRNE